jgi:hypothetical protein
MKKYFAKRAENLAKTLAATALRQIEAAQVLIFYQVL